jgi:hypothetical protein
MLIVLVGYLPIQPPPQPMLFEAAELPYIIEQIGVEVEQETGERFLIRIWLSRPIETAVGEILRPEPVEIRPLADQGAPFRPIFRRAEANLFDAEVTLDRHGQWQLILYPDVPESQRASLPSNVPTERILQVTSPPASWLGPILLLVMAAGLFAFALGGRKRKGPPKKKLAPTTGGDTWWTGG